MLGTTNSVQTLCRRHAQVSPHCRHSDLFAMTCTTHLVVCFFTIVPIIHPDGSRSLDKPHLHHMPSHDNITSGVSTVAQHHHHRVDIVRPSPHIYCTIANRTPTKRFRNNESLPRATRARDSILGPAAVLPRWHYAETQQGHQLSFEPPPAGGHKYPRLQRRSHPCVPPWYEGCTT